MRRLATILVAILFATAAYLFAWPSANIPYFAAVVLHVLSGVALLVALAFGARAILANCAGTAKVGWLLLIAGGILGAILIYTGARRSEWPLLYSHIGLCIAGGAILASAWAGRHGFLGSGAVSAIFRGMLFLALAGLLAAAAWWLRTAPWQRAHRISNPAIAPASMDGEGDGPNGPFFPSSAQTAGRQQISASYFLESQSCQRCHADIYREWQGSAHHFSSFNNAWYRKSIEYMQDTIGIKSSKWCAGCHDPALLFSGMFDRPIREVEDTPAGQAGLGCMMCHSIARVKSTMGNGDFELEYPALHRLAASTNPFLRWTHDRLVELNPEPHRRAFLKPFMRMQTAQFCSVCHKVHLDVPVNHYRWSRGFNEYDNWQASGVSGEGARSFYYPATPQMCADCHMPATRSTDAGNIDGFVHSHRFPAANTALPFVNEDREQLDAVEQFMKDNQMRVDIFALSPESQARESQSTEAESATIAGLSAAQSETTFAVGEESESQIPANISPQSATPVNLITAPLNVVAASVRPGGTYRVDVIVRTLKLGHFFPGGTVDAYDCWLELKATDDKGQTIFWSGGVADDGKGPVDPGAHFYRSLQIDARGNPINKRNTWSTHATVYVHLIPPGAADTVHYRIKIPPHAGDHIRLTAKLNYRKFAWWNTQFAFAGVHDPSQKDPAVSSELDDTRWVFTGDPKKALGGSKGIPDLPIVVMAQDSVDLETRPASFAEQKPKVDLRKEDWSRWNDYGIGLLLQGDLSGAAAAFEKITEINPTNADGWVNLGRVRVQEGNLSSASEVLEWALALEPRLARANYFYAKVLRNEGKYDSAITHLQEVLKQYPRDRVVHNDLGRILFLQRRYAAAEKEFQVTLSIDPEDLEANYNLMLCYTGMGLPERSKEFQKRYLRFKADEAAETLTGPYLRAHPNDNRERQPIHEHVSEPIEEPRETTYRAEARGGKAPDR